MPVSILNVGQGSCEYQVLLVFSLTRGGIETRSSALIADARSVEH